MSDEGKRKSYSVPIGMCYENMEIDYIIMSNFQMYGVSGPKESSKNKFISYCIEKLLQNQEKAPVRIHIFDSPERELEEFSNRVTFYDTDVDSIDACLRELYKKIKMRKRVTSKLRAISCTLTKYLEDAKNIDYVAEICAGGDQDE